MPAQSNWNSNWKSECGAKVKWLATFVFIRFIFGKCSRNWTFYEHSAVYHSYCMLWRCHIQIQIQMYTLHWLHNAHTFISSFALILHHRNVLYGFANSAAPHSPTAAWTVCVSFFSFDFIATSWECIFTTQTTIYKTEADTPTRSKGKTNWATYENYNYIHSFNLWTCNIYWHSVLVFIFRNISTWSFQCVLNIGIMGKTWGECFQVVLRASNLFWFPLSNFDWVKISTMVPLAPHKKAKHFGL